MLSSGHLLDNRYRLDERIATGGMGDVWRGTDVVLGRVVAVKVLKPAMLSDPEFAARFYGEARMMAAFRHPGVVEVYDYSSGGGTADDDDCAYLVMAYVDGEPLSARLKEVGRLGVTETLSIVAQTADALHAAHEHGTIHRDVKPGNLIVKPNGTVILVDFGVARSNAVTSMTGLNAIVGTALYMAPEQVAKGNVTPATDIYALGAVAYHCIAGHPPFDGDNALQVALRHLEDEPEPLPPDMPEPVRALISQAMAKHPGERFASAAEFADAARTASRPMDWLAMTGTGMTGTALTTPLSPAPPTRAVPLPRNLPYAAPPPPQKGTPRGQMLVLAAVVVLFLTAIGLGLAIWLGGGNDPATGGTTSQQPSAPVTATTTEAPAVPTTNPTTRVATQPNGTLPRPTTTRRSTSASASASASASPSATPSQSPSTTPTTAPTTPPATNGPTDGPTGGTGGDGGQGTGGGGSGGTP